MKNNNRDLKSAFSLMEMMVVLLIVAIIAAATAPMVSRKMMRNAGTGDSPWVFTGLSGNIAYNLNGRNDTIIIGASKYNNDGKGPKHPRLFINSDNNADHAAIVFGRDGKYTSQLQLGDTTAIWGDAQLGSGSTAVGMGQTQNGSFTATTLYDYGTEVDNNNATAIGFCAKAKGESSIAIGDMSTGTKQFNRKRWNHEHSHGAHGKASVAIGRAASAIDSSTTSIGDCSTAFSEGSVAIGAYTSAGFNWTTAVGTSSFADNQGAIALGAGAWASGTQSIAIGNGDSHAWNGTSNKDEEPGKTTYSGGQNAIAVGTGTQATGLNAIAIGPSAKATAENSVAIGADVVNDMAGKIMLGGPGHCVYIPGDLYVGGKIIGNLTIDGSVMVQNGTYTKRLFVRSGESWDSNYRWGAIYFDDDEDDEDYVWADTESGVQEHVQKTCGNEFYSDRRLKNVGEKYTAGLDELKKLEFFNYTFKKDENKTPRVGVMAQDLQKVFPDAVTKGDDGYLRIRLEDMFYAVINAVKELDAKIAKIVDTFNSKFDNQNQRIENLEKQNSELVKQNSELLDDIRNLEKRIKILEK